MRVRFQVEPTRRTLREAGASGGLGGEVLGHSCSQSDAKDEFHVV